MRMEEMECLEEIFAERHFRMDDDHESISQNCHTAEKLAEEYQAKVERLADALTDGMAVDMSDAILSVQTYIFAHKYVQIFRGQMADRTV